MAVDLREKDYIVVVQCDIVMERCSGYGCEQAFHKRTGGFAAYPADRSYRTLYLTCGGCCGQALLRKLTNLVHWIKKTEGVDRDRIVVQLATCITKDNWHSPVCPFLDYLETLVARLNLDCIRDTHIVDISEKRRAEGVYGPQPEA